MSESADAWKAEEQRQTQILADLIQTAILEAGQRHLGAAPLITAVAGALVTVEAGMLAAIPDARLRKQLRRSMERARPAAAARAKVTGYAQIVDMSAPRH